MQLFRNVEEAGIKSKTRFQTSKIQFEIDINYIDNNTEIRCKVSKVGRKLIEKEIKRRES